MPGPTQYLPVSPTDFDWEAPAKAPSEFEGLIERYVRQTALPAGRNVSIQSTPRRGDQGKDLIVEMQGVSLELFGCCFPATKNVTRLYIECKSTARSKLDDSFLIDQTQHTTGEATAYMLVTNATITPYSIYRAHQAWQAKNMAFHLVDGYRLVRSLWSAGLEGLAETRFHIPLPALGALPTFDRRGPVLAVQTETIDTERGSQIELYLVASNYSDTPLSVTIGLTSDLIWEIANENPVAYLSPGELYVQRLEAICRLPGQSSDIHFRLACDERQYDLHISPCIFDVKFDPYFVGHQHHDLKEQLQAQLDRPAGNRLISIHGEAGVGKTRTVDEALSPYLDTSMLVAKMGFDETGRLNCDTALRRLGAFPPEPDKASLLSQVLDAAEDYGLPVTLVLEDVHHSNKAEIRFLKHWALSLDCRSADVNCIVTGRDDHTYPNDEYFSFLSLVGQMSANSVADYHLNKLTDDDARTLIAITAVDFPVSVQEKIHALGENNPFIILQVFEYLIDMKLAEVASRRTIGLHDPAAFAAKKGLPDTITEIYSRRFMALQASPAGKLAFEFLAAASFFGFGIAKDVWISFFDDAHLGDEARKLLFRRKFVKQNEESGELSFAHENLLHNIHSEVCESERALATAQLFFVHPGILKRLPLFSQAKVHYLAAAYRVTFDLLETIWVRLVQIENFSAQEIDRAYFPYIPLLFESAKRLGKPNRELLRVATAYCYMAVHNFPLVTAVSCCEEAEGWVASLRLEKISPMAHLAAIAQLKAHALQNMGRTGEALRDMLELSAKMDQDATNWGHDVKFDLFDRLQEHYRKTNHQSLANHYGRLARTEAGGDTGLQLCHAITQAGQNLYCGYKMAGRFALKAKTLADRSNVRRLQIYTRLTELVIGGIYCSDDREITAAIYEEAVHMLRLCAQENFSDSIMRLELLLAVLSLRHFEDQADARARALFYVDAGLNDSARYGNGLFDWAFHNLAGAIQHKNSAGLELAGRHFETCRLLLKLRGLAFLGDGSAIFPTALAISNIVRFQAEFSEKAAISYLRTTADAYANDFLRDTLSCAQLVRQARSGKALFWRTNRETGPRLGPSGYFTFLF